MFPLLLLRGYTSALFMCLCLAFHSYSDCLSRSYEEPPDDSTFLLIHAAMQGDIDTMRSTLREREGINTYSSNDLTALHYAILYYQEEAALFLIENGANILACDRWGNTPLILAKARNLKRVVDALEQSFVTHYSEFNAEELKIYESNKRFAIIVPSYNNAAWCKEGLASVFNQKYENYYVIFVDDCSTDGNADIAEQFIHEQQQEFRCQIIKNDNRKFKMANLYKAIHQCEDMDVVVILDGDDRFSDKEVFSYLNHLYRTKNVWLTAGGYKEEPSQSVGFCRSVPPEIIKENAFRTFGRITSQLRTFYAWLFKQLSLEDLFYKGKFFQAASDIAKMIPMFELSGERIECNQRIVYVYNLNNTLNDHKVQVSVQVHSCEDVINRKKRYTRLSNFLPNPESIVQTAKATAIISADSYKSSSDLLSQLALLQDLSQVVILCKNHTSYERYQRLRDSSSSTPFPFSINVMEINEDIQNMYTLIDSLSDQHIFFLNGSVLISNPLKINELIKALEKTGACTWQGKTREAMKQGSSYLEYIQDDLYAWQFDYTEDAWKNAYLLDIALYRKKDLLNQLSNLALTSGKSESFRTLWNNQTAPERAVGLCSIINN